MRLGALPFAIALAFLAPPAARAQANRREAIVADHTSVDAPVPLEALRRAQDLKIVLGHASVGFDVIRGLRLLSESQPERYRLAIQPQIQPWWFNRNAGLGEWFCGRNGDAVGKIDEFERRVRGEFAPAVDVASLKLCYADVLERTDPAAVFEHWKASFERLEKDHPDVTFVWWTVPVPIPSRLADKRTALNDRIRAYARSHGAVLFDVADIESHDANGRHRLHSGGGEGLVEAWARDQGGHLNDEGAQRAGRAWWWLMARCSGWEG